MIHNETMTNDPFQILILQNRRISGHGGYFAGDLGVQEFEGCLIVRI